MLRKTTCKPYQKTYHGDSSMKGTWTDVSARVSTKNLPQRVILTYKYTNAKLRLKFTEHRTSSKKLKIEATVNAILWYFYSGTIFLNHRYTQRRIASQKDCPCGICSEVALDN